nr:unnamed protein product [Digitaria exilis]
MGQQSMQRKSSKPTGWITAGEAVGADGRGADEGAAFRAEEDDAPEGGERAYREAFGLLGPRLRRRREAVAAAVAEREVGLAPRGRWGRQRRRRRQGRAWGRGAAARPVLGEEARRRWGWGGVVGEGAGCVVFLRHG